MKLKLFPDLPVMNTSKKYFIVTATIYKGKLFKCKSNGVIDWSKTVEYTIDIMKVLVDTRHKIRIVKYNHGINTEDKTRFLQEE